MSFNLFFCILLAINSYSFTQEIPSNRITDWSKAGLYNSIENGNLLINIIDFGAKGDSIFLNDNAIKDALSAAKNLQTTIYFPEGNYKFTKPINLHDNVTIKGESSQKTKLIFDLNGSSNLFNIIGKETQIKSKLKFSAIKSSKKIVIDGSLSISKGSLIKLYDNDSLLIYSDWALNSVAQLLLVTDIKDDTLFVDSELRKDFLIENNATIQLIELIRNVSIECLSIIRNDPTSNQTSNFNFQNSFNCSLFGIESINTNFAHVSITNSKNIKVSSSYFNDGFDFGGGGKSYGVVYQQSSSDCLAENNIFNKLRHSMLIQSGANGNVFAYNYSINPYWTEVSLPSNSAGDIVLHGNYPFCNLFESNVCQNIVIDNSHGLNGPFNTFFRNRAELYGIFMNSSFPADSQNFIGNEVINTNFLFGNYILAGKGHLEFGNLIKGNLTPSSSKEVELLSLYRNNKPEFYKNENYPSIGIIEKYNQYFIPAQNRFLNDDLTICKLETGVNLIYDTNIKLSPNPASEFIKIKPFLTKSDALSNGIYEIKIYNSFGECVMNVGSADNLSHQNIDISNLPVGIYFIQIANNIEKFVVLR